MLDWLLVLNQLISRHSETDRVTKHEIKGIKSILINRKLMLLCYRNCQSSVTFRTKRESWRTKERPWERRLLPYRPRPESYKANCARVTKRQTQFRSKCRFQNLDTSTLWCGFRCKYVHANHCSYRTGVCTCATRWKHSGGKAPRIRRLVTSGSEWLTYFFWMPLIVDTSYEVGCVLELFWREWGSG